MQRNVLLVHDRGWGWASIERVIKGIPEVVSLHVVESVEQAIELMNHFDPDVIIGKPDPHGESIAPLISELRTNYGYLGRIYHISDRLDEAIVAAFAWIGLDGLVPLREIPRARLEAFLCVLVSGKFRIGSIGTSDAFLDLVRHEGRLPKSFMHLSERQSYLLKAWYRSGHNPTYQELANNLNVSVATVKRDVEDMYGKFEVSSRVALGAQAVLNGILP